MRHFISRLCVMLTAIFFGLTAVAVPSASADEPCPGQLNGVPINWGATGCNTPSLPYTHPSWDTADTSVVGPYNFDKTPWDAGLVAGPPANGPYSVAVTADDWDPDDPSKLADDCEEDSSRVHDHGLVMDGLRRLGPVIVPMYRITDLDTYVIYKWCTRRLSPFESHMWFIPEELFTVFTMEDYDPLGHKYRYDCGSLGVGFKRFRIDGFVRDGTGKQVDPDPFSVPCIPGSYGNSSWISLLPKKRMHYTTQYGYPKWDAVQTEIRAAAPDQDWVHARNDLNPL